MINKLDYTIEYLISRVKKELNINEYNDDMIKKCIDIHGMILSNERRIKINTIQPYLKYFEFKYFKPWLIDYWIERGYDESYYNSYLLSDDFKIIKENRKHNTPNYITYSEFKDYVNINNVKSKTTYLSFIKNKENKSYLNKIVPSNPQKVYKEWEGWSLALGNPIYQKKHYNVYYTYNECVENIKKYNIKGKKDWCDRIKSLQLEDPKIPYNPLFNYKNEWVSWSDFLGTSPRRKFHKNYLPFEESRELVRKLGFRFQKEWKLLKDDTDIQIPRNPVLYYKDNWISWNDWFGVVESSGMSYGEHMISLYFKKRNIMYIFNKSFKDCRSNSSLRFDFRLPEYKNLCIEYDGIQHFEPVEPFGGVEEFERIKIRDRIKNDWCLVNDIKLIRFRYNQNYDEISNILDDIIT